MDGLECDLHAPDLVRLACVRDALHGLAHPLRTSAGDCAGSEACTANAWTAALAAALLAAGASLASVWWATRGTWRRTTRHAAHQEDDDASRS